MNITVALIHDKENNAEAIEHAFSLFTVDESGFHLGSYLVDFYHIIPLGVEVDTSLIDGPATVFFEEKSQVDYFNTLIELGRDVVLIEGEETSEEIISNIGKLSTEKYIVTQNYYFSERLVVENGRMENPLTYNTL